VAALGDLADDARGSAGHDAEAGYDHVRRHDGAVEDARVVLDDGHLSDDDALPDVHVAADAGGLDDGGLTDVDVVADSEGEVGEGAVGERVSYDWTETCESLGVVDNVPLVHAARRPETAASVEEAVASDGDCRVAARCCGARGRGWWVQAC